MFLHFSNQFINTGCFQFSFELFYGSIDFNGACEQLFVICLNNVLTSGNLCFNIGLVEYESKAVQRKAITIISKEFIPLLRIFG